MYSNIIMKKIFLCIVLVILFVAPISAQEDIKAIYVIDGKQIENFDGSQLKGKTIVNYTINSGKGANIHMIVTTDSVEQAVPTEKDDKKTQLKSKDESIYVVNDKLVPHSKVKEIPVSKIVSVKIIKDPTDADYIKYAKEANFNPKYVMKILAK